MSCLFIAISKGLLVDQHILRTEICDYLERNESLFDDKGALAILDSFTTAATYIKKMRQPTTWGGGIELRVICELYGIDIHVHSPRHPLIIWRPWGPLVQRPTINLRYSGSHYEFDHVTK